MFQKKLSAGFTLLNAALRQFRQKRNYLTGFTLSELLVTIVVLGLVILAVYWAFLLNQRAFREAEIAAELTQNGRVILERMTREIRQTREIVTDLGATFTDATSTIEFEDGHITERYHYIRYFKEGNDVKREVRGYYFSGSPGVYVIWNATPPPGEQKLIATIEEAKIIGEFVKDLKFWKPEIINIFLTLEKEEKSIDLSTKIFGRNL